MNLFDALRAARPDLRIAAYAMDGAAVTLEIIAADDRTFRETADTLDECILRFFPDLAVSEMTTDETDEGSVFD